MDVDDMIELKLVHEIHTSGRKAFRTCRRSWDYTFRQQYYPKLTAKPLEFGSAYHKAMEVYYNPETWDWDREVVAGMAILAFVKMCEEQKASAVDSSGHLYLENEQEEDYAERVELGKGMLTYYFTSVAPKIDKGWTPVKVEIGFMVPIANPDTGADVIWCRCPNCWAKWKTKNPDVVGDGFIEIDILDKMPDELIWPGLPVVYAGRLDMLAVDENGNYWIFDWKTAAQLSQRTDFLYLDDQIGSYNWALMKLGVNVKGFVYHEQRKSFPQPPKQNASRRLGRLFTVSKSEPLEYELYLATIKEQDTKAWQDGLYDDMLRYLQDDNVAYYARYQIAKSVPELVEIETNIGKEALDMIDPNLRVYPSPSRFGCSWCAYQSPCMEQNAQGDYRYALDTMFEQREHYYIRNDPSTEKSPR